MNTEEWASREDEREAEHLPSHAPDVSASNLDAELDLGQQDAAKLLAERDEYLDLSRRVQAEFENYRKRVMRDQAESVERGAASLVERLLPVLDALDLALAHGVEREEGANGDDHAAFVQIAGLARSTLDREGLVRIDESDVLFDPTIHDAVSHVERGEDDDATGAIVDEVLRAGYTLKGRVIRPAMVVVKG